VYCGRLRVILEKPDLFFLNSAFESTLSMRDVVKVYLKETLFSDGCGYREKREGFGVVDGLEIAPEHVTDVNDISELVEKKREGTLILT
jgi:hypothetical protein